MVSSIWDNGGAGLMPGAGGGNWQDALLGGAPSAAPGFNWPGLGNALGSLNQQDFDEMKRQFNEQMAAELRRIGIEESRVQEMIRQFNLNFDEQVRQFNRSQNQGLAMGLLNGAIAAGQQPENWLDYATYTNQGRDIFQQLTGSEPSAAFGAPTGYSNPNSITNIMRQLGITNISGDTPATATPAQGTAPALSNDAALDWIWQNRPDLKGFFESNGWDVSTPQAQRLAVQNWIGQVDPQWKGMTPQQVAGRLGYGAQSQPSQPTANAPVSAANYTTQPAGQGQEFTGGQGQGGQYGTSPALPPDAMVNTGMPKVEANYGILPVTQPEPMVSLPHQINPMVWDSMSPTAQRMILGAAQRGKTPSGVWTAEDFVRQINNARPRGNAPRRVNMGYGNSGSLF